MIVTLINFEFRNRPARLLQTYIQFNFRNHVRPKHPALPPQLHQPKERQSRAALGISTSILMWPYSAFENNRVLGSSSAQYAQVTRRKDQSSLS
jgi:hypothetical protein